MKKRFGLLFGIIASANAFADNESLLQPNTTSQNACVIDNIGVYSNSFRMSPIYEDIIYNCTLAKLKDLS